MSAVARLRASLSEGTADVGLERRGRYSRNVGHLWLEGSSPYVLVCGFAPPLPEKAYDKEIIEKCSVSPLTKEK